MVSTDVALRMFIMQALDSQLPFLANRNAELAVSLRCAAIILVSKLYEDMETSCTAEWPYGVFAIVR